MFGFSKGSTEKDAAKTIAEETETQYQDHYVSFQKMRAYLQQVKNCKDRITLLKQRKEYHINSNQYFADIDADLTEAEDKLGSLLVEVTDEISKLNDVQQEMVLTKRYVDILTWEEIAEDMDLSIRTVQKLHGYGLPGMEKILLADGKISEVEKHHPYYDSTITPSDDYYND